jgi:uncharacterized protein (DUF927 family)
MTLESVKNEARRLAQEKLAEGYEPQALHTYKDSDGKPLFWKVRCKHPHTQQKWIRPFHHNGTDFVWKEPQFKGGKPLYGLELLAREPDVEVFVCEGENCADALNKIGVLALTSGGAQSAEAADWTPLSGRNVVIWPDNDDAGASFGQTVASILQRLECTVETMEVKTFGLETKGDAVDWLRIHPNATHAEIRGLPRCTSAPSREAALLRAEPSSVTAHGATNREFRQRDDLCELTDDGLFFTDLGRKKPEAWQISGPLKIEAATRDAQSQAWGRLVSIRNADLIEHKILVRAEDLVGDGLEVLRSFARAGLWTAPGKRNRELLLAFVQSCPIEERARFVDRPGWHGKTYVTSAGPVGSSEEKIIGDLADVGMSTSGTWVEWRDSVASLASGNPLLMFSIGVALAGPLVGPASESSGGFHLRGPSSCGKTTVLNVSASVWGDPRKFTKLWRTTANGLEGIARLHNDSVLILDELSQVDPLEAAEAAYLLANEKGKIRATRAGNARPTSSWRLLFLSSGEVSLSALLSRNGRRPQAGQEIRLADIPADRGVGHGTFDCLHGSETGAALAERIARVVKSTYGAIGQEWLRRLVGDHGVIADVIECTVKEFVRQVTPPSATGQVHRVARRFGLIAAAGELATAYGLTGWKLNEAENAARLCFESWLCGFGEKGLKEERDLLTQVRTYFVEFGDSRFEPIQGENVRPIHRRTGFWRQVGTSEGREYIVPCESFSELCVGHDIRFSAEILAGHGWLIGEPRRNTQRVRLPGLGQVRAYVFSQKMVDDQQ